MKLKIEIENVYLTTKQWIFYNMIVITWLMNIWWIVDVDEGKEIAMLGS